MVSIELLNVDMWRKFHEVQNEMIITKTGRRMFPIVEVEVRGLDPDSVYALEMEFVLSSHHRLRFHEGKWLPCGSADTTQQNFRSIFRHPESPNYGSHFTGYQVSFGKVKITNRTDKKNLVCLNSHFMYHVQIHVLKLENIVNGKQIESHIHTTKLPLTQFIAVTAYQNEMVTALKIKHNPFAKAFQLNHKYRDSSEEQLIKRDLTSSNLNSGPPANMVLTPSGFTSYRQAAALTSSRIPNSTPASVTSWRTNPRNHVFEQYLNNGNTDMAQNSFYPPYSSYDLRWPSNSAPISTSCLYPSSHRSPITIAQTPITPVMNYDVQTASRSLMSPALPCSVEPNFYRQDCAYNEQRQFNMEPYNSPYFSQQCSACVHPYNLESSCSEASAGNSPAYNILSDCSVGKTASERYSSSSSSEGLVDEPWYPMDGPM